MNPRVLILVVFIFVLISAVLFFAISKKGEAPSLNTTTPTTQTQEGVGVLGFPVDPNHEGIKSTALVYRFEGRVINIEPVGENTRITLDISDSETPEFLTTSNTFVFAEPGPGNERTITDIKLGDAVIITINYSFYTKIWETVGIAIQLRSSPTPTP